VLRRRGYNDDDIANMSPAERASRYEEAVRAGTMAGAPQPEAGQRAAPIDLKTGADVERAGAAVNELYSNAQGAANNVPRVHVTWNGIDATLEAGAGGVRHGIAADGTPFTQRFPTAHGYFLGTNGADGAHLDAYFGPHPSFPTVFVLDEKDPQTGAFRQHKAFVGFRDQRDALDAYLGTDGKHAGMIAGMLAMPLEKFKNWAAGDLSQPVSEAAYNNVRPAVPSAAEPTGEKPAAPLEAPSVIHQAPEPTPDHHRQIEDAIRETGINPARVRPVDIARAAEIMAQHGLPASDAFPLAVAQSLIQDGHIPTHIAEQFLGREGVEGLLHSYGSEAADSLVQGRNAAASGWARRLALSPRLIAWRLQHGMSVVEALAPPGAHWMWRRVGSKAAHRENYQIWRLMHERCRNPANESWEWYGAKGVRVCPEWATFRQFLKDMGPRPSREHSLDRKDNAKGYSKDNCRWATKFEQGRNKQNNVFLTFNGRSLILRDWAAELGVSVKRLEWRLYAGWPIDQVLTVPKLRNQYDRKAA
jgi:Inorganic Pyrophosphatase